MPAYGVGKVRGIATIRGHRHGSLDDSSYFNLNCVAVRVFSNGITTAVAADGDVLVIDQDRETACDAAAASGRIFADAVAAWWNDSQVSIFRPPLTKLKFHFHVGSITNGHSGIVVLLAHRGSVCACGEYCKQEQASHDDAGYGC